MWNILHFGILVLSFRLTVQKPTVPGPITIEVPLNEAITFHSPGYPDDIYPANTDIKWEFHTSSSMYMKLVFTDFDIESHQHCIWDKVEIANERCNTMEETGNVLLCNPLEDEYKFVSDSTFMCVYFHSDHVIQRVGFNATVSAVLASTTTETSKTTSKSSSSPPHFQSHISTTVSSTFAPPISTVLSPSTLKPSSPTLSPNSSSASSSTMQASTPSSPKQSSPSSSLSSSSSPAPSTTTITTTSVAGLTEITMCKNLQTNVDVNNVKTIIVRSQVDDYGKYPLNITCSLTINNIENKLLKLVFKRFNLEFHHECKWDYLEVNFQEPQKYCGDKLPEERETNSSVIVIDFCSDHVVADEGFELHLQQLSTTIPTTSKNSIQSTVSSQTTDNPSSSTTSDVKNTAIENILPSSSGSSQNNELTTSNNMQSSGNVTATVDVNTASSPTLNSNEVTTKTTITSSNIETTIKSSQSSSHPSQPVTSGEASAMPSGTATSSSQVASSSSLQPSVSSSKHTPFPASSNPSPSSSLASTESQTSKPSTLLPESTYVSNTIKDDEVPNSSKPPTSPSTISTSESSLIEITMCNDLPTELDLRDVGTLIVRSPVTEYGKYPLNINCSFTINNIDKKIMKFVFLRFNLELHHACKWDYLEVIPQGDDRQKYCGDKLPEERETNSPVVDFVFRSDHVVADEGFELHIKQLKLSTTESMASPSDISPTVTSSHQSPSVTSGQASEMPSGTAKPSTPVASSSSTQPSVSSSTPTPLPASSRPSSSSSVASTALQTTNTSTSLPKSTYVTNTIKDDEVTSSSNTPTSVSPSTILISEDSQTEITMCNDLHTYIDLHDVGTLIVTSPVTEYGKYPLNINCSITINNIDNKIMKFEFLRFNLELHNACKWDYLEVIPQSEDPQKYCGDKLPEERETNSPVVDIVFRSDHVVADEGFELHIKQLKMFTTESTASPTDISPTVTTSHPSPSITSGQTSEMPSGTATPSSQVASSSSTQPSVSPSTPTPFPASSNSSPSSSVVSTESKTTKTSTSLPKSTYVTNTIKDDEVTSSSNTTTSESQTTLSTQEASQTVITLCDELHANIDVRDVGTIIVISPVTAYGKYPLDKNCSLTIDNTDNKILKFEFLRFNLELHHACKWDYLEVIPQGEDPQKYCGDMLPEERATNSPVVVIVFHSDHVVADEGFELHIQHLHAPNAFVSSTTTTTSPVSTTATETFTVSSSVSSHDGMTGNGLASGVKTESTGQETSTEVVNTASSTSLKSNEASSKTTIQNSNIETTSKSSHSTNDSNTITSTSYNVINENQTSILNELTTQKTTDATTIVEPTTVDICEQPSVIADHPMSIVTPGFLDQKYPLNRTCTIALTANTGYDIMLSVEKFELELHHKCTRDHVKLEYNMTEIKFCGVLEAHNQITPYNGCNPNRLNVYDVTKSEPVCLFQSGTSVNLKTQSITLTFYSDNVNKSGFKINVIPLASDSDTLTPMPSKSTDHQSTLTTTSGVTDNIHKEHITPLKDTTTSTKSSITSSSSVSTQKHLTESTTTSTSKSIPTDSLIDAVSHSTESSTSTQASESSSGIVTPSSKEGSISTSQLTPTLTYPQSSKANSGLNIYTQTEPVNSSPLVSGTESPIVASSTVVKSTIQSTTSPSTNDESPTVSASNVHESTPKVDTQDPVTDACSGNNAMLLDGETGYIESPGYHVNEYPPNSHCRWKITGTKPKVVMIVFETFDVEYSSGCKFDTLTIYEVRTDGSKGKKVWKRCGNVIPDLLSFKTDILIEFISDSIAQKTGFRLKYYRIETNTDKTYTCAAGMMPCLDTDTCIPAEWWCDSMVDCQDQTDEKSCDLCGEDEFQCVNGTCISADLKCDGTAQCPYGTDERSCVSLAEPGDSSAVLVNVRNDWLPLCYDESATNRTNDICNAAGFRSSEEVGADLAIDVDSYSKVRGNLTSLTFVASTDCHKHKTTRLRCTESECGKMAEEARQKRVVGGSKSMKGVWRWSVALRIGNSVVCGGSIISSEWVVTAGHCVYELVDNPQVLSIIAGVNDITDINREIRYVSEVVIHPKYDFIFEADIALLRLQSPLIFNNDIQPICLPWDRRQFSPMDICYVTGYGVWDMMHYHTTVTPKYLREVKTKIVDHETCRKMYSYKTMINDTMLCAGYAVGGMDACKGDSGGGLMCQSESGRWMLAGVVSWGDMCGSKSRPGVYTRVTSFLDWIHEETNPDSPQSLVCDFENGWCGYKDISAGNYIWTRRPGDKYVKGTVLYASKTSATSQDKVSKASLLSPAFSLTSDSCLSFSLMLSGNSNITVTVHGTNAEGEPDTPLFGIISHYPATDVWKSLDITIPSSITQLLIVSQNEAGGVSGLGLDNVTLVPGRCKGSNFMECNFDQGDVCQYTQTYGSKTAQWIISEDIDGPGNHLTTGGGYDDFGYLAVSQLISPIVSHTYISIPHCLTFLFNKQSDTNTDLVVSTYISIGGELANQQIYWSSKHSEVGQWLETSVTIPHKMFNHVVFEVRREVYSKDVVEILLDDIRITDGMCV